ncbi:MAG: aa3-type cytochrome c oxidase subunit IV [Rhizomicrobium sp.]
MNDAHSAFPQPAHATGQALSEHGHMDMSEHVKTWKRFTRLIRWGIAANVLLLVFLAIFRTHG